MDDIRNAIATAVAKAVRNPGNGYKVVLFAEPEAYAVVSANNTLPLAPHKVVSPAYRATINSDNSVSIVNND